MSDDVPFGEFMSKCEMYFAAEGGIVDQPFQSRLPDGMIRCYMCADGWRNRTSVDRRPCRATFPSNCRHLLKDGATEQVNDGGKLLPSGTRFLLPSARRT